MRRVWVGAGCKEQAGGVMDYKQGEKVRILWGQHKGKIGRFIREYRGKATVYYGPNTHYRAELDFNHIERVRS